MQANRTSRVGEVARRCEGVSAVIAGAAENGDRPGEGSPAPQNGLCDPPGSVLHEENPGDLELLRRKAVIGLSLFAGQGLHDPSLAIRRSGGMPPANS